MTPTGCRTGAAVRRRGRRRSRPATHRLHRPHTRGHRPHPDCVAALDDAVALCASLGHDMIETELPGLTPEVGSAIGTVFMAATAWIIEYWIRRLGRRPGR